MAKYADVIASAVFALFGLGCVIASLRLPLGTPLEPMPGFVPLMVSILLLSTSLIQLVRAFSNATGSVAIGEQWRRPAAIIIGLLVYSATLDFLGYIIATSALSLLILRVLEPKSWASSIVIAIAVSVASFVLFDRLLEVNFPKGLLQVVL